MEWGCARRVGGKGGHGKKDNWICHEDLWSLQKMEEEMEGRSL